MVKRLFYVAALVAGVGVCSAGCKGGSSAAAPTAAAAPPPAAPAIPSANVDAGVPLAASNDSNRWKNIIAAHTYVPRKDPFALTPIEAGYEDRQQAERFLIEQGNFSPTLFTPKPPQEEARPVVQPQPYRRLAGVLVGDSVLAIIDMGNGKPPEIVRPGQKVPGTEWTVVSIDEDKAVLHRGGTILPHDVIVPLQGAISQPAAPNPATTGPQTGPPGFPGGRFPGGIPGRPGGFPGLPGGQNPFGPGGNRG